MLFQVFRDVHTRTCYAQDQIQKHMGDGNMIAIVKIPKKATTTTVRGVITCNRPLIIIKTMDMTEELDTRTPTADNCLLAVIKSPDAIEYVPIQTAEMCDIVLKINGYYLFEFIWPEFQTAEMCATAVDFSPELLEFVRPDLQTEEMCMEAISWSRPHLRFVHKQTAEMCLLAIGWAVTFMYVHAEFTTPELCLQYVTRNGLVLRYMPDALKTIEICAAAVESMPEALQYAPLQTIEMCANCVSVDGALLQYVQVKTLNICILAMRKCPASIQYAPSAFHEQLLGMFPDSQRLRRMIK